MRAGLDARHLPQIHRQAPAHTDDQIAHVLLGAQELTGFDRKHLSRFACRIKYRTRWHAKVGRSERLLEPGDVNAPLAQAHWVQPDVHGTARAANGLDLTRARNPLEFILQRMRHPLQLRGRQRLATPQSHAEHRHIIDALGLDNRAERTQFARQPVLVGIEDVIQAHQGLGTRHPHFELNRQHGQTRSRDRIRVLDAGDLTEHLLGRARHQVLHINTTGTRKGNQYVGHRHIDLWLFFARRHHHRKQAQQQGDQRQQGGQRIGLKRRSNAPGDAHGWFVVHAHLT